MTAIWLVLAAPLLLSACASEEEAVATPVVTQPPVEPAPQSVSNYVVLFDFGSTTLTAAGQIVVAEVAAAAVADTASTIDLVGHADTVGASDFNLRLSQNRAETVRNALVAAGVQAERIRTEGRGESDLAVPTGDGVRNQANRRVVMTLI